MLWSAIAKEIEIHDCEVYSYTPAPETEVRPLQQSCFRFPLVWFTAQMPAFSQDPLQEAGSLWSFCFLFYNRKLKRVLLFACMASSYVHDCVLWSHTVLTCMLFNTRPLSDDSFRDEEEELMFPLDSQSPYVHA